MKRKLLLLSLLLVASTCYADTNVTKQFRIGTNVPNATNGSVLFVSGGVVSQDNSNVFWDANNARLGIGTSGPSYPFHVAGNGVIMRGSAVTGTQYAAVSLGNAAADMLYGINNSTGTLATGGSANSGLVFTDTTVPMEFGTNNSVRWRIASAGDMSLVGLNNIGATPTDGLMLINSTAAALNAQQYSQRIRMTGAGWGTTGSASQVVDLAMYLQADQNTNANPSLVVAAQKAGGGYVPIWIMGVADANSTITDSRMNFVSSTTGATSGDGLLVEEQASSAFIWNRENGSLSLGANNAERWNIAAAGHFLAGVDNTYDIGASGATRPRTGYFGTSLVVGGVAVPTISSTDTLTNKRVTRRAPAVSQSATPTINTDVTDVAHITGLAQAITSMTTNLSGTPVEGDVLRIDITDNGTARAITWGASFEASGTVALPTTTVLSVRLDVVFHWNTVTSKWRCVGVA